MIELYSPRLSSAHEAYEGLMARRLVADTATVAMLRHLAARSRREELDVPVLGAAGLDAVDRFVESLAHEVDRGGQLDVRHYRRLCRELQACGTPVSSPARPLDPADPGYLHAWKGLYEFIRYDGAVTWGFYPEILVCWIAERLRITATLDPGDTAAQLLTTKTLRQLHDRTHSAGEPWLEEISNPYINKLESFAPVALEWFELCSSVADRL